MHIFTAEQIDDLLFTSRSPTRFLQHVKVQHPIAGPVAFNPSEPQQRLVSHLHQNRLTINLVPRMCGTTTTTMAYLVWKAIFQCDQTIVIVTPRRDNLRDVMTRIVFILDNLPPHQKPDIETLNSQAVGFTNGSRIILRPVTTNAVRGMAISHLHIEDASLVRNGVLAEFINYHSPVISLGGSCSINSLPGTGRGYVGDLWRDARVESDGKLVATPGKNGFAAFRFTFFDHHGYTSPDLPPDVVTREHECMFVDDNGVVTDPVTMKPVIV